MLKGSTVEGRPKKLRSGATNDPRRLAGVGMRSACGRDLVDQFVSHFGDAILEPVRAVIGPRSSLEQWSFRSTASPVTDPGGATSGSMK
jgi:hypothetical protein